MKTHPSETRDDRPGWLRAAEQHFEQGYRLQADHARQAAAWRHPLKAHSLAFAWKRLEALRAAMPDCIDDIREDSREDDIHPDREDDMTKTLPAPSMSAAEIGEALGIDARRLVRLYEHAEVDEASGTSRYRMDAEACAYLSRLVGYRVEPAEGAESAALTDAAGAEGEDSGEDEREAEAAQETGGDGALVMPAQSDSARSSVYHRLDEQPATSDPRPDELLAEVNALHGVARILARLPREARTRVVRYQIDLYELGS